MMKKEKWGSLKIAYLIDFLLAGRNIFTSVMGFIGSHGQGPLAEAISTSYLLFNLPTAVLLIALGLLIIKRKAISIILHILYYSFTGGLVFVSILLYLPFLSRPFFQIPASIFNYLSFFVWSIASFGFSLHLNLLVYILISVSIVILFTRPQVREQFSRHAI